MTALYGWTWADEAALLVALLLVPGLCAWATWKAAR